MFSNTLTHFWIKCFWFLWKCYFFWKVRQLPACIQSPDIFGSLHNELEAWECLCRNNFPTWPAHPEKSRSKVLCDLWVQWYLTLWWKIVPEEMSMLERSLRCLLVRPLGLPEGLLIFWTTYSDLNGVVISGRHGLWNPNDLVFTRRPRSYRDIYTYT